MTTEELIISIARTAPRLAPGGLRVLLELVALAISTGSNEVTASHGYLADRTGLSREGVARGLRNLAMLITKRDRVGYEHTFILPEEWFSAQRPLFTPPQPPRGYSQGAKDVTTSTPTPPLGSTDLGMSDLPGLMPSQASTPHTSVLNPGDLADISRHDMPINIANYGGRNIRNAGARIDSSRIEYGGASESYIALDRAFHTVEILPHQREDAEILSAMIQDYRDNFDSAAGASSRRDSKVIARILAIGAIEDICDALRALAIDGPKPGFSDMWFFSVLMDKLHGIHHTQTAARIEQLKTKAQSLNGKPSLFPDQLVNETAGRIRKLG